MARIASKQIAGYYPTPSALHPLIAATLRFSSEKYSNTHNNYYTVYNVLDPCAGDGEVLAALGELWSAESGKSLQLFGCELESGRYRQLRSRFFGKPLATMLEGDAFYLRWTGEGAAVLFLNPPYDYDSEAGRLEQKFLERFTQALCPGFGALVFVVPQQALRASAEFLSQQYVDLRAYRFPSPEFELFRQVVVVGRRSRTALPTNAQADRVLEWGRDAEQLPVLGSSEVAPLFIDPAGPYSLRVSMASLDISGALEGYEPWSGSGIGLDQDLEALIGAKCPSVLPPKPGHIALALGAGQFNGHTLRPNDRSLPSILAKGVFRRSLYEVGEKTDQDGMVVGSVQVERPELELSILRLDTFQYLTVASGAQPTCSKDLAAWNIADVVHNYSESLAELLLRQFPPLHDPKNPAHQIALPELPRKLFEAQKHAAQALLKLLAQGSGAGGALFDAEVGFGKTTTALAVLAALSEEHHKRTTEDLRRLGFARRLPLVRRTLVLLPPHLIDTWTSEIAKVLPAARVQVLETVSDLDREADVFLLTRETAKLGHAVQGVEGVCPGCGAAVGSASHNSRARSICGARVRRPRNFWADIAQMLATALRGIRPEDPRVSTHLPRLFSRYPKAPSGQVEQALGRRVLDALLDRLKVNGDSDWQTQRALGDVARGLGLEAMVAGQLEELLSAAPEASWSLKSALTSLTRELRDTKNWRTPVEHLLSGLETVAERAEWDSKICEERLYQAIPSPRRFPLAKRIMSRYRRAFDLVIVDELHEYANRGSAQSKAAQRLISLPGVPTIAMTGSLSSGYASSLFCNMWGLSARFRAEFPWDGHAEFLKRYGYRKVLVEDRAREEGAKQFGAQTDRKLQRVINLGEAPGVLPSFVLRHLLPSTVVGHKADLDVELPQMTETPVPISAGADPHDEKLLAEYERLAEELLESIRKDRFVEGRSGKLFGALLEVPSYLDMAAEECGPFEIRYPEDLGGDLVASATLFPDGFLTPKERFLIDAVRARRAAGEKLIVFLRHTGSPSLPERIVRILRAEAGVEAVWLNASKVSTAKREQWIRAQVIEKDVPVLVVSPEAVRTGLNCLVAFSTAIWYESTTSALTYRQANGRLHRFGQTRPVSILVPYYQATAQQHIVELVAAKVAASLQVDGLDVRASLEAAGAGENSALASSSMALAQAVYERLQGGEPQRVAVR